MFPWWGFEALEPSGSYVRASVTSLDSSPAWDGAVPLSVKGTVVHETSHDAAKHKPWRGA